MLTAITALLGFFKTLPDLRTLSISRIDSEFEKLKKLESHLGRDEEAAVHLQRKLLTDRAAENLHRSIYVQWGMSKPIALGCGCISSCLFGFEIGLATVLGWLFFVYSQKNDDMVSFGLLMGFLAVLLTMGLTVATGNWINAHIALNRQFRLDMQDRSHNMKGETDASLQKAMDKSFDHLAEYERRKSKWKILCAIEWFLITFLLLAYACITNGLIPVQPFMDLFGLSKEGALNRLSEITVCAFLVSFVAAYITAIRVLLLSPDKKDKDKTKAKATKRHQDDANSGSNDDRSVSKSLHTQAQGIRICIEHCRP